MNLNRRDFLCKSTALLAGMSFSSCRKFWEDKKFKVIWIHLEGAPYRPLFDLWIDPLNQNSLTSPTVTSKAYQIRGQTISVPDLLFKEETPSPLLKNWASIRGLETTSPHLQECREEWLKTPDGLPILEELTREGKKTTSNFSTQMFTAFPDDSNILTKKSGPELSQIILKGYKDRNFEEITDLSEENLAFLNSFYAYLLKRLEVLVTQLEKIQQFEKTMIIVTGDRTKTVVEEKSPYPLESTWQGHNFSLLSGAIMGPLNIGHIYKEHPKYAKSYPGTWGVGNEQWRPTHFHSLLKDLLGLGRTEENPWLRLNSLNQIFFKVPQGIIL